MTPLVQLLLPLVLAAFLLVSFHQPAPVSSTNQPEIAPAHPEVMAEQIPGALYSDRASNQLRHL